MVVSPGALGGNPRAFHVAGIDEVGRGPLAGPVAAAAVILPEVLDAELEGLDDSKKLSPATRERLESLIKRHALAWAVASASVPEIEALNILQATHLAMRRAFACLSMPAQAALVDGNSDPGLGVPTRCIIRGDGTVPSIAAASILAKVARDRWMRDMDALYPGYGFAGHKGYGGSATHREAILRLGPSPIHRPTFLRKLLGSDSTKSPVSGAKKSSVGGPQR
jgi:ribonuclease HII